MTKFLSTALIALSMLGGACTNAGLASSSGGGGGAVGAANQALIGNHVSGDLGVVQDVDAEASVECQHGGRGMLPPGFEGLPNVEGRDDSVHVQLNAEGRDWAVMHVLNFESSARLVVGATLTNEDVSLVGCSGAERDDWTFDEHADDVEVEVSEGATNESVTVTYRGTFQNADNGETQVAEGECQVPVI